VKRDDAPRGPGNAGVSRETVQQTVRRFAVPDVAATTAAVQALLLALAREPDPPTTVREPGEALDLHVADSLAGLEVEQLRSARRIVDLGAGAGFPGLVLAAALPQAHVDLVESTARKCEVIERLANAADIAARIRALPVRAEDLARGADAGTYDAATARALAPLPVLCEYAAPLLRVGGVFVAWKGAPGSAEVAAGASAASKLGLSPTQAREVSPFPGTRSRHLYVYSKISDTPAEFPRRTGLARKRPLG
jgi:16S rRNA (guanine527-N7)-methyltransferase